LRRDAVGQFVLAWVIGFPAIVLAGEVDGRFAVLLLASGGLLIALAVRAALDDRAWEVFLRSQRRGNFGYPGGRLHRVGFAFELAAVGLGFTTGGVLGFLAIFDLYDFPDA
jgi:hypothetical protein